MALEPPVKKRRRHDFFTVDGLAPPAEGGGPSVPDMSPGPIEEQPDLPSQAETAGDHAGASGSPGGTPLELSQRAPGDHSSEVDEEKLRKKRNREEVDGISKAYRRLKGCLSDDRDSPQDVEQAFRAMLSFATGCASVRRIAAELIPRYAVFCPGCLGESSQTILHICDWSGDLILQGDDTDCLAEETARAAYAGLVELSAAAVTKSSESSSSLGAQSAAVCRNIALYLLHQLHGRPLVDADCGGNTKAEDTSAAVVERNTSSASEKLEKMVTSSTLNLFHTDPEGMLSTCFDLLESPHPDTRKEGQHFLREIMAPGRSSISVHRANDGQSPAVGDTAGAQPENATSEQNDVTDKVAGRSANVNSNLVKEVIHPRPALERWIVNAVRHFRRSASQDALAESHVLLTDLVKSLRSFVSTDLELDGEELDAIRLAEDERVDVSFASEEVGLEPERSGQGAESENGDMCGVEKYPENGVEGMPGSSDKDDEQLTTREHKRLNGNHHSEADTEDLPPRRERLSGNGFSRGEKSGSGFKPDYRSWDSGVHYSRVRDSKDAGNFGSHHGDHWDRAKSPANGGSRKDVVSAIPSPPQPSTPQHSSSPNRNIWYHDGDPAAMDVYAASQHLWVGSIGQGASESSLRFEFEQFGQVDSVNILRGQDFALVDFKNVRDAVKARETLQGKLHFGKSLQIKFLDGVSSRGSNGGAPLGGSCHVWIGGISSQSAKDELLNDLGSAGLKGPRTVLALVSASAILLEFEAAEDAGKVVLYVRQRRKEGGIPVPPPRVLERSTSARASGGEFGNRHLWVGRIDPMVREEDLVGAFAQYGELTGWKLLRASSCCFIDFRSSEEAAVARVQLNGTRFGCQCIQVEFKNNPNRNPPPPHLSSPPHVSAIMHSSQATGGRMVGGHALSTALANLSSKFHMAAGGGNLAPGRNKNFRVAGREATERVPTNTLWIGLPDCVGPSFMNESELKSLFNMATAGVGGVTKVRSARTSRGPCRFVEFDTVEAAAIALRSVSGRLDASIQIEFSNSAISMQQSENPQLHGFQNSAYGQGAVDDSRRRAFDHHRDRERAISRGSREWEHEREDRHSSPPGNSDEAGTPGNRSLPPGWGGVSDKEYPEESDRREHRRNYFENLGFGGKVERGHGRNAPFSQSPVTPAVSKSSRQSGAPPAPVAPGSPPAPPGGTPPFSPSVVPSSLPPPPRSPPPPPREFASEVSGRRSSLETRGRRGPQPWIGPLCKSGMQYCEVIAYRQESAICGYENGLREPLGWPEKLDVTKRADYKSVKNTFNSTSPQQREVCRLFLSPAAKNHDGFEQFVTYLKERDRAGVVKISGGDRIWSRMLYILPWKEHRGAVVIGFDIKECVVKRPGLLIGSLPVRTPGQDRCLIGGRVCRHSVGHDHTATNCLPFTAGPVNLQMHHKLHGWCEEAEAALSSKCQHHCSREAMAALLNRCISSVAFPAAAQGVRPYTCFSGDASTVAPSSNRCSTSWLARCAAPPLQQQRSCRQLMTVADQLEVPSSPKLSQSRTRRNALAARAVGVEAPEVLAQSEEVSEAGEGEQQPAKLVREPEPERDFAGTEYIPIYVMLPLNTIHETNKVCKPKHLRKDLEALKAVNVDGVMVDCWWGLVEGKRPLHYDWSGYRQLFHMVEDVGLKLQVVMSFHECGGNVGDDVHIPLPEWILEVGKENPDIFFTDRHGTANAECLTFGVDKERVLRGRTGLEVYYDFMKSFRQEFDDFFIRGTITEIEVGLGACGELRYPSYPEKNGWKFPGVGEFQCYDKYLLKKLKAAAERRGHPEWGTGPDNAGDYNSRPQDTEFFRNKGDYDSYYGRFFLRWYSKVLIEHGDRVLNLAQLAFDEVKIAAKVSGIHWWYNTESHAAELAAGFYNSSHKDGYAPIATMLAKHKAAFNFTCVELSTEVVEELAPQCLADPEALVWQVLNDAWDAGIEVASENALPCYDRDGYNQILESAKPRKDPDGRHLSAFTYLRLNPKLMEEKNFREFERFVKRMHGEFLNCHTLKSDAPKFRQQHC